MISVFWSITPYSPVKITAFFFLVHARFFLGLFFSPEDGGDVFHRNFG
jgi:hypothetical protein